MMIDHIKNAEPYASLRNSHQFLTKYISGRYTDSHSFTFLLIVTVGRPMINGKILMQSGIVKGKLQWTNISQNKIHHKTFNPKKENFFKVNILVFRMKHMDIYIMSHNINLFKQQKIHKTDLILQ